MPRGPQNLYCPGNRVNTKEYKNNWERIFGKKDKKKEEKKDDDLKVIIDLDKTE